MSSNDKYRNFRILLSPQRRDALVETLDMAIADIQAHIDRKKNLIYSVLDYVYISVPRHEQRAIDQYRLQIKDHEELISRLTTEKEIFASLSHTPQNLPSNLERADPEE